MAVEKAADDIFEGIANCRSVGKLWKMTRQRFIAPMNFVRHLTR
ncbi:MAG: hypothetical protein AAFX80_02845 [Cyanobacteria bacterium J06639_18]